MTPLSRLSVNVAACPHDAETGHIVTIAVVSGLTTATLIMAVALVGNLSLLMGHL